MEVSMLSERVEPLLRHMEREGYSRHTIEMTMADARWLERNGSGYETFEDALDARCAETGCPRVRATRATSFRRLKRFLVDGELPEYGKRAPLRPKGAYHELPGHMREVADCYRRSALASGLAESTAAVRVSALSRFLLAMHEAGRRSLADVTERDVLGYITTPEGTPRLSGKVVNDLARVLSSDLGPHSAEAARIAALIPRSRAVRRNVQFLTEDECERVLEALASPEVSRLDRAIVTTLYHTGLRAGDVAGLELGDIDWYRDEVRLTQAKTGTPLVLPLLPAVGNAIYDYIEDGRPESRDPHVLLQASRPHRPLTSVSVRRAVGRVFDAAGIRTAPGDRRGAHLFRYHAATSMVGSGVPRSVASAVLGHEDPTSIDSYLFADIDGLRACALDVSRFPVAEGVFR